MMPEITTIRVLRRRSVSPEQFGNATAEVELTGNVLEGEDPVEVAREMLVQSRALVYENLGKKLPSYAVDAAKDVEVETAKASTKKTPKKAAVKPAKDDADIDDSEDEKPKKAAKKSTTKKAAKKPAKEEIDDDIPDDDGDDTPEDDGTTAGTNLHDNPEDRVDPSEEKDDGADEGFTAKDLSDYINTQIKAGNLHVADAKRITKEAGVARLRDLKPDQIADVKKAIDEALSSDEIDDD